jgi:hypothetical protein
MRIARLPADLQRRFALLLSVDDVARIRTVVAPSRTRDALLSYRNAPCDRRSCVEWVRAWETPGVAYPSQRYCASRCIADAAARIVAGSRTLSEHQMWMATAPQRSRTLGGPRRVRLILNASGVARRRYSPLLIENDPDRDDLPRLLDAAGVPRLRRQHTAYGVLEWTDLEASEYGTLVAHLLFLFGDRVKLCRNAAALTPAIRAILPGAEHHVC